MKEEATMFQNAVAQKQRQYYLSLHYALVEASSSRTTGEILLLSFSQSHEFKENHQCKGAKNVIEKLQIEKRGEKQGKIHESQCVDIHLW